MLAAGILFSGLILAIYRQDVVNQSAMLRKEAQHVLDLQQELLSFELKGVQSDLLFLATQDILQQFLMDRSANRHSLEKEHLNFALKKGVYDQIRFLNVDGMERIRVNYHPGKTEIVPLEELQSKASRYYFQQAMSLKDGEVFVSPFDLNVEHGIIEQPIEPVIRFVTPVFDENGKKQGLLVLNYLGTRLLSQLRQMSSSFRGETMLVNLSGEYLQAPNSSHEWGWLLDHTHSFRNEFLDAWERGKHLHAGQFRIADELFTFQRLSPGVRLSQPEASGQEVKAQEDLSELLLISHVSAAVANAQSQELLNKLLLMLSGVMAVVALLAYYWARSGEIHRRHEIQIAESELRLRQLSSTLLETHESE